MPRKTLSKKEKLRRAEEYDNSRPIDVWRISDYPEVKSALNQIFNEMQEAGLVIKEHEKKLKDHIRAIVLDLYVANQTDPTMYIRYSRRPKAFNQGSRYSALFFGYWNTLRVVDFLQSSGYAEGPTGYKNVDNPAKSKLSRMRATQKLISLVKEEHKVVLPMIRRDETEEIIILKDTEKKQIEYEDTDATRQMRENLRLINRNLDRHATLLYAKDSELEALNTIIRKDPKKGAIDFTKKRLRRIFNNGSWEQGGRLYDGWWQNVPREYRHYIRLNDKDVAELDFSGLHINMLYAMAKQPMPKGDVYFLEGYSNSHIFRTFVKTMLQAMVNAATREKARQALHKSVRKDKELELPSEISSTGQRDIYPLMDAFQRKHKPIEEFFCTGKGIDLQYLDSQMAEKVMLHFSKMGYAILPLHDSFIIHHALERELRDSMETAFKDMFGVKCKVDLKYNSIKKRLEDPEYAVTDASDIPLSELLGRQAEYGTYFRLLNDHRKYHQQPNPTTPGS